MKTGDSLGSLSESPDNQTTVSTQPCALRMITRDPYRRHPSPPSTNLTHLLCWGTQGIAQRIITRAPYPSLSSAFNIFNQPCPSAVLGYTRKCITYDHQSSVSISFFSTIAQSSPSVVLEFVATRLVCMSTKISRDELRINLIAQFPRTCFLLR